MNPKRIGVGLGLRVGGGGGGGPKRSCPLGSGKLGISAGLGSLPVLRSRLDSAAQVIFALRIRLGKAIDWESDCHSDCESVRCGEAATGCRWCRPRVAGPIHSPQGCLMVFASFDPCCQNYTIDCSLL